MRLRLVDVSPRAETIAQLEQFSDRLFDAWPFLKQARKVIPFEHLLVLDLDVDGFRGGTGMILASTFPAACLGAYYSAGYGQADPLVRAMLHGAGSVADDEIWDAIRPRMSETRLRRLLSDHRIGTRTAVPVVRSRRVCGSIVVATTRPLTFDERSFLEFLAEPLHALFARALAAKVALRLKLTKGEIRCLELASQGLTSEGIADRSEYTVETVNSYLKFATKKLGCSNRSQTIAEAMRRRLIS